MKYVCKVNTCSGCNACINICPQNAIELVDNIESVNAKIDLDKCINCGLCEKTCPNICKPLTREPILWKQGWAREQVRRNSSSGGAATAIMAAFIRGGGYVASCIYESGQFRFKIINSLDDVYAFAGSKYVKSNAGSVYSEIKKLLANNHKVLFLGLPCQCAAIKNYCAGYNNLFTVDLICHGTPSFILLDIFIKENNLEWKDIESIHFRDKNVFGLSINNQRLAPKKVTDSYLMTYLEGVDYTENCYSCGYASLKRVSDISLGDAWGQLSDCEQKGVSLILCQTKRGETLLENAELHLEDVDIGIAKEKNEQLLQPSSAHPGRARFMKIVLKSGSFRHAATAAMPITCLKQSVKTALIRLHIWK